jgi:LPS export ABC transporter protein LptC
MRWQQRARLGIAIFGIVFAGIVYFAIGKRVSPTPAPAPKRVDPSATVETSHGVLDRVAGSKLVFRINFERMLTYENGATKLIRVRVDVKERQGRDFVITAGEAQAGAKHEDLQLSGNVKMEASDGFVLLTDVARFNQVEGIVRAAGPVSFSKGRMTGSGHGMTYDKNTDVLVILDQARVKTTDEGGKTTGEFTAGKATFARMENYLLLETAVHVLRGEQTLDAERVRATLTDDDERITFIELREKAAVAGGSGAFDSMRAEAIDLGYADDGQTVERVVLSNNGAIALKGQQGGAGRRMLGDSLALAMAPDGAVTSATGVGNVEMELPPTAAAAGRRIRARTLDASGQAGKGLTSARFTDAVEYREEGQKGGAARVARSRELVVGLEGDAVIDAVFRGQVQFEEQGLKGSAAEARYDPAKGVLRLKGADEGGGPRVADEQIEVEADAIDVTLEGRSMRASANVKTVLRGQSKSPGLLKAGQPANVSAAAMEYDGDSGRALYTGAAQLWQGDTAVRGDAITIDRGKGNLSASGNARSTLAFGSDSSIGRAEEIRYEDASRQLTYTGRKPAPKDVTPGKDAQADPPGEPRIAPSGEAPVGAAGAAQIATPGDATVAAAAALAQLSGPQGDLRAHRIVVHLAKSESRMERLEAFDTVTLRLETRVATSSRVTYFAADERYVLSGTPAVPVKVVETCRETIGQTLTFFKTTDRIIVDGNEERRTQTKTGGGPCQEPRSY